MTSTKTITETTIQVLVRDFAVESISFKEFWCRACIEDSGDFFLNYENVVQLLRDADPEDLEEGVLHRAESAIDAMREAVAALLALEARSLEK